MKEPGEDGLLDDEVRQIEACVELMIADRGRRLVITGGDDGAELSHVGSGDVLHVVGFPSVLGRLSGRCGEWLHVPFATASFEAVVVAGLFERLSAREREVLAAELERVCDGVILVVAPLVPPFAPMPRIWRPRRTGLAPMMRWRVAGSGPAEIRLCGATAASSLESAATATRTVQPDRSHAIAVFAPGRTPVGWSWRWFGRRSRRSVTRADLRNALQRASSNRRDGHWVRWRLVDGTAGVDGVGAPIGRTGRLVVQVPVGSDVSALEITYRRTSEPRTPTVIATIDDRAVEWEPADGPTDHDGFEVVRYEPPDGTTPELAEITVVIPEGLTIATVDCRLRSGDVTDLGVEVRPGPNLTLLADGPVRLSWHLQSDRTGWLPTGCGTRAAGGVDRPIALWPDGLRGALPSTTVEPYPWDLVQMFQSPEGFDLPAPWTRVQTEPVRPIVAPHRRVLMVAHMFPVPYNPVSGAFVFESAKAIVDRGVPVRVICPVPFWGPGRRQARAHRDARAAYAAALAQARRHVYALDGVEVQYVPYYVPGRWHRHAAAIADAMGALRPEIEQFGPDIVHAHSGYLDGHAARRLAGALRIPYVITEHTGPLSRLFDDRRTARTVSAAYRGSAAVFGVSSFQAREIKRLAPDVAQKVSVQFNGYDASSYSAGTPSLRLSPTLIYVGYITPGKGLDVLVQAFVEVARRLPGARLLIAGDVADETIMTEVLTLVRSHRIGHLVEFVGGCTRAQVAELMHRADALVLPSEGETFGCVVAEALGAGRLVVATACGGPEDIARGEPAVRLVPIGDAPAVALAVEQLWHARCDPALQPAAIAQRAADRFDYRTIAGDLVACYDRVIAGTSRPPTEGA